MGLMPTFAEPCLQALCNELRTVVGSNTVGLPMFYDQLVQDLKNVCRAHLLPHGHAKCLAGVFVEDGEHTVGSAIAQAVVNEVNAPDMAGIFRP